MSSFSWLDHSDDERRRVLEVIDRFRESESRDELGLGTVRDVFSDLFFPGTSTLQTRARYFLFVPWIYRDLEGARVSSAEIAGKARRRETQLMEALKISGDSRGMLGRRAGATLKRLPSSVYWIGLGSWGIRTFVGSQDDYHRSLDRFHRARDAAERDDDQELVPGSRRHNWHSGLPESPPEFPTVSDFTLRRLEAKYLVDRIGVSNPRSLLAFLARYGRPAEVAFAWQHPQLDELSEVLRRALAHARCLAETMQGAALLYNVLLAEARAESTNVRTSVDHYRERLSAWAEELASRASRIAAWDRGAFWALVESRAHIAVSTRRFVEEWQALAPWTRGDGGFGDDRARALVRRREQQLKGARSRLTNPRALELWSGESGTGRLDFRWGAADRLLADVYAALGRGGPDAEAE